MQTRNALDSDAGSIADLLGQLGYPASEKLVSEKLILLSANAMDAVLVVADTGTIVGVISLHVFELFHQAGRIGRITSLVVSESARGKGVGTLLVSAADTFFCGLNCVRADLQAEITGPWRISSTKIKALLSMNAVLSSDIRSWTKTSV